MKLIVGLGNPGKGYARSLHNVGFICVNYFARRHKIRFNKSQAKARIGTGNVEGYEVIVARPQTYMNRSGEAVVRLVKRYNIALEDILVIYDDMDLPLGKIRIRIGGSSGGHKGVKSIINELNSEDIPRLRIGIGRPDSINGLSEAKNTDVITYLLSELPPEDKKAINKVLPDVNEAIRCVITEDLTTAMNKYN
ncbi:aminoacyl-tRNA hydrolase [Chloroflexota bacterium]